jgi:hypothetical protein
VRRSLWSLCASPLTRPRCLATQDSDAMTSLHGASQQLLAVAAALGLGGLRLSAAAAERGAEAAEAVLEGDTVGGGGFPAHHCVAIGALRCVAFVGGSSASLH